RVLFLVLLSGVVVAIVSVLSTNPTAFMIGTLPISTFAKETFRFFKWINAAAALVFAVPMLYLQGGLLWWAGSLFGGKARAEQVRAAVGWSAIPQIVWTIAAFAVIRLVPMPFTLDIRAVLYHMLPIVLVTLFFGSWTMVVVLKCVAEVHRFSVW